MFGARVNRSSLRFTLIAIGNAAVDFDGATEAAVRVAGHAYASSAQAAISYSDHTLAQLARMDHPYARRHGRLTLHAGDGGGWLADGTHLVHRQSGQMVRTFRTKFTPAGAKSEYEVGLDPNDDHVRRVLLGTPRMLPRDPLWSAANGPNTIDAMQRAILRELGRVMRSQAHVRFRP